MGLPEEMLKVLLSLCLKKMCLSLVPPSLLPVPPLSPLLLSSVWFFFLPLFPLGWALAPAVLPLPWGSFFLVLGRCVLSLCGRFCSVGLWSFCEVFSCLLFLSFLRLLLSFLVVLPPLLSFLLLVWVSLVGSWLALLGLLVALVSVVLVGLRWLLPPCPLALPSGSLVRLCLWFVCRLLCRLLPLSLFVPLFVLLVLRLLRSFLWLPLVLAVVLLLGSFVVLPLLVLLLLCLSLVLLFSLRLSLLPFLGGGVFFWAFCPVRVGAVSPSFCSELFMKLIECTVEGLTAYLKTLAADDPTVPVVELLIKELKES